MTDYGRLRLSNSVITQPAGRELPAAGGRVARDRWTARCTRFAAFCSWSALPAGLLVAAVVGRWMAGFGAGAAHAARRRRRAPSTIADLQQRLPVRGTADELDDVAHAFNDTLARLEHAVGEMRQFSAALAHELRTPLAALRGEIEMAMLRTLGLTAASSVASPSQLEEIDKLKRLIDQILTLARAEAGEIPLARIAVDLGALAASLVEQLEPVAQATSDRSAMRARQRP